MDRPLWFQFSLRSLLWTVAVVAFAIGLVLEARSQRKQAEEQLRTARDDFAAMLFQAQLGMAGERLHSQTACPHIFGVLQRDNDLQFDGGCRFVRSWEFAYHKGDDLQRIRCEISSALEPVSCLGGIVDREGGAWITAHTVTFDERTGHGLVTVTAEYH